MSNPCEKHTNPLTRIFCLICRLEERDALIEAAKPILQEMKDKADFNHKTWNPDAHVEITVTIAECRALQLAAEGKQI